MNENDGLLQDDEVKQEEIPASLSPEIKKIKADVEAISTILSHFENLKGATQAQANNLQQEQGALKTEIDRFVSEQQTRASKFGEDLKALEENLKQYDQLYATLKGSIDQELPNFRNRVETEQASLRQNLEKISSDFQTTFTTTQAQQSKDFSQAQEERGKEYSQKIKEFDAIFTQAQTQQSKDFSQAQEERNNEYKQKIKEFDDKMSSEFILFKTKMDSEFNTLTTKSGTIISILMDFEAQAKKVLGVVVNTAQAGVYKTYADEEKKVANFFRRNATACLILAILILIGPELKIVLWDQGIKNADIDWGNYFHNLFYRAIASIVLFAPTFYFSRESTKHRNNEFRNRKMEHILITVDPYLELLEPDKKSNLKAELAKNIFNPNGNEIDRNSTEDDANLIAQITNLVATTGKLFKNK